MKIKTSQSYTTYENVLKYHEKHQFRPTTDTETLNMHIIGTVSYNLAVGKGGCSHPTSQGDDYTRCYQSLKNDSKSSPWTFPSDPRLCRVRPAPCFMRNKTSESSFSPCSPCTASHVHPTEDGMPVTRACKPISAGTSRLHAVTFLCALGSRQKI